LTSWLLATQLQNGEAEGARGVRNLNLNQGHITELGNYLEVGHNRVEFWLVFGQLYSGSEVA
jgi:hypothetical protein